MARPGASITGDGTVTAWAVRFSTLARLCDDLGCQPGDLLTYRPAAARIDA